MLQKWYIRTNYKDTNTPIVTGVYSDGLDS